MRGQRYIKLCDNTFVGIKIHAPLTLHREQTSLNKRISSSVVAKADLDKNFHALIGFCASVIQSEAVRLSALLRLK